MTEMILLEAEENMDNAIEVAKNNFASIRTGQASSAMFANIAVDYYGAPTPLQQLASINVTEARTVVISPYDAGAKKEIETALRNSDLGVNPSDDGQVLRIVLPQLTEERRREYVKLAKTKAEESRVTVRNMRRKAKDQIDASVKDGEVGEDEGQRAEKELDALTKKHVDAIDALLAHKESELLEV
ncbi:ribosome recycling factor [Demequina sp. SYSU T00192]|uniref:Ribosome-recycling factor n=2 Tax=Demequina litoralis TaxID=3051660 RepID=A0ABT8G969_9MICO|nr:ribosome recycling factor [Demequina sp. SYSU T00192]MDN4475693.1 ribosome recycling factor [Demequina sp. SYSU T00192]